MGTPSSLKTGLLQMNCSASIDENLDTISRQLQAAAQQGVQLVLLQELHNNLYFCQTEDPANFDLADQQNCCQFWLQS